MFRRQEVLLDYKIIMIWIRSESSDLDEKKIIRVLFDKVRKKPGGSVSQSKFGFNLTCPCNTS